MDFAQLKTSLKTQIAPVYWAYGTDIFLLYKTVELLQKVLPAAEVSRFDETADPSQVLAALQTTSLLATQRLVIYTIGNQNSLAGLASYLAQPAPDSTLLILSFADKAPNNYQNLTVVDCHPLPAELLVSLIAKQIAPFTITKDAAQYLIDATGGDYSNIDHELQKLLAFYQTPQTLTVEHLAPYLNKTVDYQIYELGSTILQQQTGLATKMLQHLLSGNSNEYVIFAGLVAQIKRAYYATSSCGDQNAVAKVLGCSPYAIKYSRRDFNARATFVKAKYAQILQLEYQMKSGQISLPNALTSLIYR